MEHAFDRRYLLTHLLPGGVAAAALAAAGCSSAPEILRKDTTTTSGTIPESTTGPTTAAQAAAGGVPVPPDKERSLYWLVDADETFDEVADRVAEYDPASRLAISRVLLSFADVNANGMLAVPEASINQHTIARAKETFPNARIGLAVGGETYSIKENWDKLLDAPERFSTELIAICRKLGFTAIALDYEFPKADQRERFLKMTKIAADGLAAAGVHDVSVAIPPTPYNRDGLDLYGLAQIPSVHLEDMTYNFHGNWEDTLEHDSAMQDVSRSVQDLLAMRVPGSKIYGGVNFYGYHYRDQKKLDGKINKGIAGNGDTINNTKIQDIVSQPGWQLVKNTGSFYVNEDTKEVISVVTPEDIKTRVAFYASLGITPFAWSVHGMTNDDLIAFATA